jgi:hypothetical protein
MKRPHHTGMVAGVGTAVGAVILSMGLLSGCAPGTICDKDEYAEQCKTGGANGTGTGGTGGSNSGTGGTNPSAMGGTTGGTLGGGTGGSGAGGGSKAVANCAMAATVAEVETKILAPKCAEAGCHVPNGAFKPDLKSAESFARLLDKPVEYVATKCKDDVYVKKSDPMKSYFLSTVKDAMPKCSDGRMGGLRMPFGKPPLSDAEITCIEGYVRALAE